MHALLRRHLVSCLGLLTCLLVACGGEDLTAPGGSSGTAGGGSSAGQSGAGGVAGGGAGQPGGGRGGDAGASGGASGACVSPQAVCNGTCVDTTQDAANCGECGQACATGESCVSGFCQGACAGSATKCGAECVDPQSDPKHCGGCATVCTDQVCSQGKCAAGCGTGLTECGGACVDLLQDMNHCGDCANTCDQGQGCVAGKCVLQCAGGQTACGDVCVTTGTDPQNCGGCGKTCLGAEVCVNKECTCQGSGKLCQGVCTDIKNDNAHCGDCDKPCGQDAMCSNGTCQLSCSSSQKECGDKCTDTSLDSKNCGKCGHVCATGEACSNGTCSSTCAAPTKPCNGSCVDLQTDGANCGGCGLPCGPGSVCVGGACQVSCAGKLNSPVTDAWGNAWDGLERAAGTLAVAETTCQGLTGRLPTATELFRVSATQSATVGQSNDVNPLWSRVPSDVLSQAVVRLSDGVTNQAAVSQSLHYRCVCPAPHPDTFTGASCNGPQGSECVSLVSEGGHVFIDATDRARLTKAAAIFECSDNHGRVAMPEEYAALIATGALGSGAPVRAGDEMSRTTDATVVWKGNESLGWKAAGHLDNVALTAPAPFRCVGVDINTAVLLPAVPSTFPGTRSRLVVDSSTRTAGSWGGAYDVCTAQGGHVARTDELWRLAQDGLPGDNLELSTADQDGASINTTTGVLSGWLLSSIKWSGKVPRLGSGAINWISRTAAAPLVRCVYYPLDKNYPGPTGTQCNSGGCFSMVLTTDAKVWIDREDRSPDATLEQAYTVCREHGGRLASQRDIVEAVHANLGNGSGRALLNSDLAFGTLSVARAMVSLFTDAPGKADTDQYSAAVGKGYTSWSNLDTARPYRCMWTNELR